MKGGHKTRLALRPRVDKAAFDQAKAALRRFNATPWPRKPDTTIAPRPRRPVPRPAK